MIIPSHMSSSRGWVTFVPKSGARGLLGKILAHPFRRPFKLGIDHLQVTCAYLCTGTYQVRTTLSTCTVQGVFDADERFPGDLREAARLEMAP